MAHISMMFDTEGHYQVAAEKDGRVQLVPALGFSPKDREMTRFLCTLRLLSSGKILVGSDPDDSDEGAAAFQTLREIIEAGTKRIACFFRQAIFDAQSFCGESINVIVLVIPAGYTTAEKLKLYAAASMLGVSLRLIMAPDALAFALADERDQNDNDTAYYGVLRMDMESMETALYNYASGVMELMEIHINESPMGRLAQYVAETLTAAALRDGAERETISSWAIRKITYQLFQLREHAFPFSVDLSEVAPAATGTYSFEWDAVQGGIGDLHIKELKNNPHIFESSDPSEPFLLIVNGYDYQFPLIEAAIKRQNAGGTTLFCREKPYALLAAYSYTSMLLDKSDHANLILSATPHALYLSTGETSRICLVESETPLPTRKSIRISIDSNGKRSADIVVCENETPILYAPIPLTKRSSVYTLTFDQRFGSWETKQTYYTAQIVSEDGLSYNLLPCDPALIPRLSDSYGPVIRRAEEDGRAADRTLKASAEKRSGKDTAERTEPTFDPLKDGDTIPFQPIRSNQGYHSKSDR